MIPDITASSDPSKSEQSLLDEIASLRQQLAEFKAESSTRDNQIDAFSQALRQKDEDYNSLFAQFPRGMQEEDYSEIKKSIDQLRADGVVNLKEYFESNPIILRDIIRNTRITNVNQSMLDMTRNESLQDYLDGEEDIDGWWDADWADYYAHELDALAGSARLYEDERTDIRADSSILDMHMISTIVRGYEDTWERVITIIDDITERKRNEKSLKQAISEAEQASLAKSEFLSSMSHELRTPLNAILGFSELLEYDDSIGEQQQSSVREISRAGQHLLVLIDEILDLSRIESGKAEMSIEPVFVTDLIEDSLVWVDDIARNRGISILFDAAQSSQLLVLADAVKLKQVLLNLLSNAVKYNRENGQIRVICGREGRELVRIGIQDSGPGISADKINQLFEPFKRLGAEHSDVEGTGIGLVITRHLINLMDGRLEVDSTPGKGSTFWVELPFVEISQTEVTGDVIDIVAPNEPTPTLSTVRPYTLVAEDNLVNRELIAAQMEQLGYQADFAENGADALKLWKSGKYQLLLTDIRMPVMDGYELIRQIRTLENGLGKPAPIIVISANAMGEDVKRCFAAGANDVMSKPLKLEVLRKAIKKWSSRPEPAVDEEIPSISIATDEVVDLTILRETVGDDNKIHRQLLGTYIDALPEALGDIQQAIAQRDTDQLVDFTHKLKSSTRAMGASRLAELCERLEVAGKQGNWSDVESTLPPFLSLAKQVEAFVVEFCEGTLPEVHAELKVEAESEIKEVNLSVLLVDDDPIMHRVSSMILNDLGINQVRSAISGSEALEVIDQQGAIDLVICDLNMPEMDGIEFIRHLASRSFSGSLVLTSGEDIRILRTVEKLAIEHELNMLGVLEKPVTPAKIKKMLDLLEEATLEGTVLPLETYEAEELLQAIDEDQLDTYFQPKVDIKSGEVVGVEALVRWHHPSRGIVSPYHFITLAEEHNLISKLTQTVCAKALQHASRIHSSGYDLGIALNISVDTLNDLSWPDTIAKQIESAGLQPSAVTFEVTESRLMEDIAVALDILSRLSLKRFNLAIDDFGTGYSSMEQLQRIPFSELKIDRAFVRGASEDLSARAILESSIQLARKLDMKIVAEGVETRRDWDLVAELGCDQVQGYYIAKPMPIDRLIEWLGEWETRPNLKN